MAADQEAPKKASTINDQAGKASASLAPAVKEHAPASNFPQTKFSVPVTLKPQATQQEVESAMSKSVPGSPPPPDKVLGSTTQAVAGQKGKNSLRVSYTPLNKSTYTSTARRSTQNSVYGPIQSVSDSVPEPQGVPSHGGGNLMADQRNQRAASPDRRSNGSMRPPLLKSGSSENKVVTGLPPRKSTLNVSRSSTSSSNPQARVSSQSPTIAPLSPTRSTSDGVRPDRLVDRPSNDNGGTGMKRSASPMQNDAKRAKPRSASTPHVMNLAQYPEVRDLVVLPGFGSHFGIPFRKSHGSITCLAPSCDKQTFGSAKAFLQHAENKNHRGFDIRKAHVPRPERNSNSVSNAAGGERSASSVNVSQYNGEFGGSRRNMHEEVRVSRAEPVKTPDLGLASKSIDLTVRAQATDKAPVETTKVARVESSKENGPGSLARPTSVSASQPISSSSLASQQFAGSKAKPAAATTAVAKTIPAPAPLQPFSSKTPDHRVSASDQSSAVDGIDNVSSQTPTTKVATASAVSTEEATRLEKLWRTHLGFESMRNQMPEPSVWAEVSKISEAKIKSFLATKDLARSRSEPLGKPSAPLLNPKIEAIRQESAKAEKKPPQAVPVTPALRARDALPSTKRPSSGSSHTSASKPDERPGQPSSSTSDRSNTKREDSQGSVNSAQEKLAGQARVKYPEGSNLKTARPLKRPRWEYILVDPNTEKSEDEKIEFTIGKTRRQERVLREGSDEPLKTVRPKRANRVPRVISRLDEDSSDDVPLRIAHGKSGEQASPSGTMSFESSDSDSEVPVPRSISPKNVRRVKQEVERKPVPARSTPLVSEKKKQPSPVSFSNSPMQNKVQESAPGPVTPMMARLEAHMMLGKAINVDDWVRAKLGSHKNVTDFLAKVAAVLPRNVSLQNSQAGDSKAESATSKPMRTIPNSDKFVPQGSPRAPQGESDAPVVKTMASPQISQSKAMDRKLCIYCGVLAEPGVSEKHLAFHERQGDVPSVDLLKRSGGRADMVGTVVHISHGKLPTLKQRAPKDAERPVYAAMPLHYGDLTDTRNAWQQTKDCAASNISPVLFCMDCVDGQPAKCRFKIIRKFVDPPSSDDNLRYVLASIHNHETDDEGSVSEVGLRGLSKTDAEFVFRRLVRPLEEFAQIEDEHEQQERILHRPRTRATGAHCDACFNLIFSGYWTCYLCGTFLCLDCFTDWQESPDSSNIPFDTCKSVAGQPMRHSKHHMIPFTSFREQELDDLLRQAQDFSPYIAASVGVGRFFKTVQHADWALPLCVEGAEKLSLSLFQKHWAIGEPLLLQGLEERTKRFWTPTKLLTLIGDQTVDVIAGNSNVLSQMRLKDFLNIPPTACLRLAGLPLCECASSISSTLLEAFDSLLPVPEYTSAKGRFNLDAWSTSNILPVVSSPVLYAGSDLPMGSALSGSALKVSMYDTINIMTWGDASSGNNGCAIWDIFPQRNASVLRRYMLSFCGDKTSEEDPVRRARRYLTEENLVDLRFQYHVTPVRVCQKPGEALLIPAGSFFQVASASAHISLSSEFVSPENLNRYWTILANDKRKGDLFKRNEIFRMKQYIFHSWLGISDLLADEETVDNDVEAAKNTAQAASEASDEADEDAGVAADLEVTDGEPVESEQEAPVQVPVAAAVPSPSVKLPPTAPDLAERATKALQGSFDAVTEMHEKRKTEQMQAPKSATAVLKKSERPDSVSESLDRLIDELDYSE